MSETALPLPPLPFRRLVGPTAPEDYGNPTGRPIYGDLADDAYRAVFDFGCGCGRTARQLLLQTPRPGRYVGVDANREMVEWCAGHLTPTDPNFRFVHHDVYSPLYAPDNSRRLTAPFPVGDGEFSLLIAHSVFTHITLTQADHYLREVARVLAPDGVARTTWLFFDNESFPFLADGPYNLFVSEHDFSAAVLYDRGWFLAAVRRAGLGVRATRPPRIPGHQWVVWLEKRTDRTVDRFPLGADGAEWVCGATRKPIAAADVTPAEATLGRTGSRAGAAPDPATS